MQPIYRYHPETGEFLGHDEARESPREPGVYLVPANATVAAPPEQVPQGCVAVFHRDTLRWSIEEDHRGCVYSTSTGEPAAHGCLGPIPEGTTKEAPPPLSRWNGTSWEPDEVRRKERLLEDAKGAALNALWEAQLAAACAAPDSPQEVKDYAALRAISR